MFSFLLLVWVVIVFGMALWPVVTMAQDQTGGPFDLALLGTYGWIVSISLLGGLASFYLKVKAGNARWVNLSELIGELTTSAIAGLITYWLCRSTSLNPWMTAAFVGISGHMGSRALFMLEKYMERFAQRVLGASGNASAAQSQSSVKGIGTPTEQESGG